MSLIFRHFWTTPVGMMAIGCEQATLSLPSPSTAPASHSLPSPSSLPTRHHPSGSGTTVTAAASLMDYPLVPSISRSSSIRDSDRERDEDDIDTLVDTPNITSTGSRSSRMRLGGYGTATGLANSSSSSSFPLVSSTSDSGNTSTAFLAPRLTRHSSHPNPSTSTLPTSSHPGTNIHAHSSSHSHRSASHSHQHPTHEFLYPMHSYGHAGISSRSSAASVSMCSTAANSPVNSRAGSPSPFFYSSTGSASSSDEDESEPPSPYLNSAGGTTGGWWREDSNSKSRRRWPWLVNGGGGFGGLAAHPRRRRRMNRFGFRTFKRLIRSTLCRRPFIPKQPGMIVRVSLKPWSGTYSAFVFLGFDITDSDSFRHIFDFPPRTHPKSRQGTSPVEILLHSPLNVNRPSFIIPFYLLSQSH